MSTTSIDTLFSNTSLIRQCQTMNLHLNFLFEYGICCIYLHPNGKTMPYNPSQFNEVEMYNSFTVRDKVNNLQ